MKIRLASVMVACLFLLIGCSKTEEPDRGMALRAKLLSSNGYSFTTEVNADFGDKTYTFGLDCQVDSQGSVGFTVIAPEGIAGITGKLSAQGGALTFDDTALAFEFLANGRLSPVSAPWLLVHTLHEGYIVSGTSLDSGMMLSINDSYRDDAMTVNIYLGDDDLPTGAEVFCEGQRILSMTVENFIFQ